MATSGMCRFHFLDILVVFKKTIPHPQKPSFSRPGSSAAAAFIIIIPVVAVAHSGTYPPRALLLILHTSHQIIIK